MLNVGGELDFSPESFRAFATAWLSKRKLRYPRSTWSGEEGKLEHVWLPLLGDRLMHEIRRREILPTLDKLVANGLSPATHNRHRALLHRLWTEAITSDPQRAFLNPIAGIAPLREAPKRRARWLREHDAERYVEAMYEQGRHFGLVASLLVWSGCRICEALAVTWGDVDFRFATITIRRIREVVSGEFFERTKGQRAGGSYSVIMPPRLQSSLERAIEALGTPDSNAFVCASNEGGKPPTYWQVYRAHGIAIKRARVSSVTPHGIRHFFATNLQQAGLHRDEIRVCLGHSSAQVTDRYIHGDVGHLVAKALRGGFGSDKGDGK